MSSDMFDAAFLLETGWTQQQYEEADDALIERMVILMNAKAEAGN